MYIIPLLAKNIDNQAGKKGKQLMAHITSPALKAKHAQTPHDIYYSNLEEAYGNLPVPTDDWAEIKKLLSDNMGKDFDVETHIDELQHATEVIRDHYERVADALGKECKYG